MRRTGREEAETRLLWIEYDISVKTSDSSYSTSTPAFTPSPQRRDCALGIGYK
jgi:hypothetical protein